LYKVILYIVTIRIVWELNQSAAAWHV
jgi:hypothetical protein